MTMPKYRGIVIGCGNIGVLYETVESRPQPRSHASALSTHPRTELCAFVGIDDAECARARSFFDVPGFTDLGTCIQVMKPDIAIVAASTSVHVLLVSTCVAHGVPMVIGEKPLATDIEHALVLAEELKRGHSVFALNYQRRYFPLFKQARDVIRGGWLGRIREVECLYDNGLFNNGGHAIDAISFLIGAKMVAAEGRFNVANLSCPSDDANVDGYVHVDTGARISLRSFDKKTTPIHDLHIVGDGGSVRITEYGYAFEWKDAAGNVIRNERDEISMTSGVLADVISAYETKREPESGVENGLSTLAVLEALRHSAEADGRLQDIAIHCTT